jgi:WD40 repeat protein
MLWDVCQQKPAVDLTHNFKAAMPGLFSPVENIFAFASLDRTVHIWNMEDRDVRGALVGHAMEIKEMALLPDGQLLVSGCSREYHRLELEDLHSSVLTSALVFCYSAALFPQRPTACLPNRRLLA